MATVCLQRGHCFRTSGSTGTAGRLLDGTLRTEQQYVAALAPLIASAMRARGHRVHVLTADERVPWCDVFVALHQDGSSSSRASGASVGYPASSASARYASLLKAAYQLRGWPYGFRSDNYTAGLRSYYGYRRTSAPVKVLLEHGFATRPVEQSHMWANLHDAAAAHADALELYLGRKSETTTEQEHRTVTNHYENVPTPTLRTGSTGGEVTELQRLLVAFAAKGTVTSPGPVDGIYGAATARSVTSLQRVLKVGADGVYGPYTATALSAFVRFLAGVASAPKTTAEATEATAAPTELTLEQRVAALEKADEWLQAGIAALAAKVDK